MFPSFPGGKPHVHHHGSEGPCQQYDALVPSKKTENKDLWEQLGETYRTEDWKAKAREWLAGAVRVPTESYDNMSGPGEDPRWETFGELHEYLESAFPLVHSTLSLTKVNTYALLYEWTGTNASLKPLLLAAHQDGILTAIETMLEKGFKPERTVVLAFGYDEEASGHHGAKQLGIKMEEVYGQDAFAFIVDEGGGFSDIYGTSFALPGIAEKGYIDVRIDVASPGGHSSVPPPHTTIGMLAKLVVEIEEHPYEAKLTRDSVLYSSLQCHAAHGSSIEPRLRRLIRRSSHSNHALHKLQEVVFEEPASKALAGTTTAVDLVSGGVKTNALPEQAYAVVNHRIDTKSSVEEVTRRDTHTIKKWAERFNLSLNAFGEEVTDSSKAYYGSVVLSDAFGNHLAPAPVTPTSGDEAKPYELLSGTIRGTFAAFRGQSLEEGGIAVAPGMPSGNTDTRYYWGLSDHIFRYNHKNMKLSKSPLSNGVHTVNEYIEVEALYEMIWFFSALILNTDEATSV
ncbi:hypothetical protein D9758_017834 [Tetrapyrgos nigripes]|uniref:Peptidase M20 dimerisation domain-containing protein n=1 Tax=Tetrapyrgos nigripes TaxID=182062 RepID=A0A8H5B1X2_9AGAR|nr:hypothetical protein D9758_017834 [Tetrapyrgos nigripes]